MDNVYIITNKNPLLQKRGWSVQKISLDFMLVSTVIHVPLSVMEFDLTLLEWNSNKNNSITVFLHAWRMLGIFITTKNTV